MIQTFTSSQKIGDIVSAFAGASNLFKQHQIDFCCGGGQTLEIALRQRNIDEQEFLRQLNAEYLKRMEGTEAETDWQTATFSGLIDHIIDTYHLSLQKELPLLSEFVTKVLRVHGQEHPELARLHRLFHQLKMELEQHLIAEEELVFPLIKEYGTTGSKAALQKGADMIGKLEAEHGEVGDILKEMRAVTNDYQLPAGACRTYTVTFQKLIELESDIFQHVHLENNILFPAFCQAALRESQGTE